MAPMVVAPRAGKVVAPRAGMVPSPVADMVLEPWAGTVAIGREGRRGEPPTKVDAA